MKCKKQKASRKAIQTRWLSIHMLKRVKEKWNAKGNVGRRNFWPTKCSDKQGQIILYLNKQCKLMRITKIFKKIYGN